MTPIARPRARSGTQSAARAPIWRATSCSISGSSRTESTRALRAARKTRPVFDSKTSVWSPSKALGSVSTDSVDAQLAVARRQPDREDAGVDQGVQAAGDEIEDRLRLNLRRQRVPDLVEGLELPRPASGRLVEACVLDRHGRLRGEERDDLFVLLGERGVTAFSVR